MLVVELVTDGPRNMVLVTALEVAADMETLKGCSVEVVVELVTYGPRNVVLVEALQVGADMETLKGCSVEVAAAGILDSLKVEETILAVVEAAGEVES